MTKVFKGRKGWQSAGFNMTAVSAFLSLGLLALFLIGLINNTPKGATTAPPFNWTASLLIVAGTFLVWLGMLAVMAFLMRNTPRAVRIEPGKLVVEELEKPAIEIPFADILFIRKAEAPVSYMGYKASFRGALIHYKAGAEGEERDCLLSARDTRSFDELLEQLLALTPRRSQPRLETINTPTEPQE